MTRAELISRLVQKYESISPKLVDQSVREVFEAIIENLAQGRRVELRGFGTFELTIHPPRTAHNPRTRAKVELGERRIVRFRPGGSLRELVNGTYNPQEPEEE